MKRFKQFIVISASIIFLSIAVYLILLSVNNMNKIENLNGRLAYAEMVEILDEYFLFHGTYPRRISDLWINTDSNDKEFIKSAFLDPFSTNNSDYLLYCPQYSVNNDFIEGFFLVSRGYDKRSIL